MSSQFECYVHISHQKYDIIINDLGFSVKFSDIYPKVQQIVKIGLNEDISFITHNFEIFEYMCRPTDGSVVKSADQFITHKSRICISRKVLNFTSLRPTPSVTTLPQSDNQLYLNLIFPDDEKYLLKSIQEIKAYNSIVMAINIGWDLKSGSNFWDKVCDNIKALKISDENKRIVFCKTTFYHWTNHYVKTFYVLNGRICPQTQEVFDLLKIVHILDLDKLYDKNSCIPSKLECISKLPESIQYYNKYLKDFRTDKLLSKEKMESISQTNETQNLDGHPNPVESPLVSPPIQNSLVSPFQSFTTNKTNSGTDSALNTQKSDENASNSRVLSLKEKEKELIEHQKDIKAYHSIVMAINIGWNLKDSLKNWDKVGKQMWKGVKDYKDGYVCRTTFREWTLFYIQNYYNLNGKIEPISQKIFDSLKIVHILDLDKLYAETNPIPKKVQTIYERPELKEYYLKYLKEIRLNKIRLKEKDRNFRPKAYRSHRSVSKSKHRSRERSYRNDVRSDRASSSSRSDDQNNSQSLFKEESHLKEDENEIKDFHKIVLAVNIGWNFIDSDKNWRKVSQTINEKRLTPVYCNKKFYYWTRFYVKTYDKLNGKLESSAQKIFDLLKVVHTLDLDKFDFSQQTLDKIESISNKYSFAAYFSKYLFKIRDTKVQSKEDRETVREKRVTQKHLNAFQTLLISIELTPTTDNPQPISTEVNSFAESQTTDPKSYESESDKCLPSAPKEIQNNSLNFENKTVLTNPVNSRPFSQVYTFKPIIEKKGLSFVDYMKMKDNSKITTNEGKSMISLVKQSTRILDPRLKKRENSVKTENISDKNEQQIDGNSLTLNISQSTSQLDPRLKKRENTVISENRSDVQQIEKSIPSQTQTQTLGSLDPRLKKTLKRSPNIESDDQSSNRNKRAKINEIELICLD